MQGTRQPLQKMKFETYAILFLSFVLAFVLRVIIINEYGFSEDEVRKTLAARGYIKLDFSGNPSQPSLNKLAMTFSILILGESEFAVRLPNAIAGALTVFPIYFLGKELYNDGTGLFASFLWAVNIPAISFSTIGKEDALLTLFWTWAVYFYTLAREDPQYFRYCGICVGLSAASKFTTGLLVVLLLILYFLDRRQCKNLPSVKETALLSIPLGLLVFIIASFPLFLPATFVKTLAWFSPTKVPEHTGYYMMGQMFPIRPPYYLLLHIFLKNSLIFVIILIIAVIFTIKDRFSSDRILLIWVAIILGFFSFFTFGYARYSLAAIPALMLLTVQGIYRFLQWLGERVKKFGQKSRFNVLQCTSTLIVISICLHSLLVGAAVSPYYRMYVNELGGGLDKAGYYFPHDSVYDYYLREAVFYINEQVPQGSVVATSKPGVGEYYGRQDLKFVYVRNLPADIDQWDKYNVSYAIIQVSMTYYENIQQIENLQATLTPVRVFKIFQNEVVEVYRL
ncbi:MAG: ArnT family glycosyltransferase [Candidatus Hodarchaeota archaeon]